MRGGTAFGGGMYTAMQQSKEVATKTPELIETVGPELRAERRNNAHQYRKLNCHEEGRRRAPRTEERCQGAAVLSMLELQN